MIALLVTRPDGKEYVARFYGHDAEAHAMAFIDRKEATHAFGEVEGEFIDQGYHALINRLYPVCPHGLALWLCAGPQHYPMDM